MGSGPAGLAAAHDLRLRGYRVTIFEALPVAGGMLNVGIPPYRLPRDVVQTEVVQPLQDLGVEIHVDTALGRDVTFADLRQDGFDAVILATGCTRSRDLQIEGMHLDGVLKGVDFLLNASLGRGVRLGRRVIAVGGGNVAVDVARSALRMPGVPTPEGEEIITAMDVARSALRLGAPEVHVVCLEDRSQMPAYESEIRQAEEEGVVFHTSLGPKRILGEGGRVRALETVAVSSVFDADGRFSPSFVPNTESVLEGDTVILAIGQSPDLSFLSQGPEVEIADTGMIRVEADTGATAVPGIFAVGDVVDGPRNVIEVIASGRRVALGVHRCLSGEEDSPGLGPAATELIGSTRTDDYDRLRRQPTRLQPAERRRFELTEVDRGHSAEAAMREARRCLQCQQNIFIDADECVLCGGCVDACPHDCIQMISLSHIHTDERIAELAKAESWPEKAALVMDETRCIRCGVCVQRCPVGAITMESITFPEVDRDGRQGTQAGPHQPS